MESTPRTVSPRTMSPLPDPPEMGHGNGNLGQRMGNQQRSDADIENVWTRAMITMVSGPIGESIDALKVNKAPQVRRPNQSEILVEKG